MFKFDSLRLSRKLAITAVTAFAVLTPLQAVAQIRGSLSNFDVWNFTGMKANDFEVFLGGVKPGNITYTYRGSFPNSRLIRTPTGTIVRWTGASVPDTGKAHFGVGLGGNAQPIPVAYTWTFDGNTIGPLPPSWQGWNFNNGARIDVIRNWGPRPIFVQRRVLVFSGPLALEDLMRDSPIWQAGVVIDPDFRPVFPGEDLTFEFKRAGDDDWYIVMYDEMDADGNIVMTFLNAAQAAPDGTTGGRSAYARKRSR